MSVRPHPTKGDGWWIIDYYPAGRKGKRERVPYHGTEGDAIALELELRRGPRPEAIVSPIINDLIPDWLVHCKNNLAETTCRDIRLTLRVLTSSFGHMRPNQLTPALFEQYKKTRIESPKHRNRKDPESDDTTQSKPKNNKPIETVSKRTVNKELSYLSSLLNWAVDHGHAHPLTFKIKKFPRSQTRPPVPRPLTHREVNMVLQKLDANYRLAYLLMADAGLRRNESLRLRAEDVDLERGLLYITGKGNKERLMPITSDRLRRELENRKKNQPEGWLTVNPKTDLPYRDMKKALIRAANAAGLGRHLHHHLLRHSFCTNAMIAGIDPRAVQSMAGHSDPRVTQMYTHIAAEFLKSEASKFRDYTGTNDDEKKEYKSDACEIEQGTTNP